mmetsp:Transcript_5352/g.7892  ORF Transcript_5352/g.7892 Transcript_5352/m.7892 type:complete len:283 (+) Transcript_5352:38-886(+)
MFHDDGWMYPLFACAAHYSIVIASCIFVNDILFLSLSPFTGDSNNISLSQCHQFKTSRLIGPHESRISSFLIFYTASLLISRLVAKSGAARKAVLYEYTWLCNSTLILGVIGLRTCRPLLVTGPAIAVSIDQVMWYVDLIGWASSGFKKFPIGVAKYLTWKETDSISKYTCTHHLWTIPLHIYAVGGDLPFSSYGMSIYIVIIHVLLSRLLTPFYINLEHDKRKYLNVNLSHELWRDITFGFLQISKDNPPAAVYLFRLVWRWLLLNLLVFLLLRQLVRLFL